VNSLEEYRRRKASISRRYAIPDDRRGGTQVLVCLASLAFLWASIALIGERSLGLTLIAGAFVTLFTLRALALLHECGHGSLFRSASLNRLAGFTLGVLTGMPQYVWSRHHLFHHDVNGNWQRSRGTLNILSLEEYRGLTPVRQRRYRWARHLALAPIAGLAYLLFNPRWTWMKGCCALAVHLLRQHAGGRRQSLRERAAAFQTEHWKSAKEFHHMTANNIALLVLWGGMCWAIGPARFLVINTVCLSLAGAAMIVMFTIHHNFDKSYAADNATWDPDAATLHGTSFVILPGWLHWFTANVGYHHVHHLCAGIPNYRMVQCHDENADLFVEVTRISWKDISRAVNCLLWDSAAKQIIPLR
jgi:omega-6 fatty acid desaturase (delta-12 desaturase)